MEPATPATHPTCRRIDTACRRRRAGARNAGDRPFHAHARAGGLAHARAGGLAHARAGGLALARARGLGRAAGVAFCLCACAAPAPIDAYLEAAEPRFDPAAAMLRGPFEGPRYHTSIVHGQVVHPTVASLDFALALLARGAAADRGRAERILGAVLSLQEQDAGSEHYGLWPWFLEEPVAAMTPPDRNWADFCGARVAQALVVHPAALGAPTRTAMRASLRHAATAITARDVDPGYTNVAIMGAGVAAAAGEILGETRFLEYGRRKLQEVLATTAVTGNFREYNSPVYGLVVVMECERTLHLVGDPICRAMAASLLAVAWRGIAASFHPGTGQWAGPHSRAYEDRLTPGQVQELAMRVGLELRAHPDQADTRTYPFHTVPRWPCPPELARRFAEPVRPAREIRRVFRPATGDDAGVSAVTWMDDTACLGSVDRACLWDQRRPLLAYWRTAVDPGVVLRVRALKDGRDFAALGIRSDQRGASVSSRFEVRADRGEWHLHLDTPADGTYRGRDLRIRYELRGREVTVRQLDAGTFALRAGDRRALLRTTPGEFFGQPVTFEIGRDDGVVHVDAVLYRGSARSFDFRTAEALRLRIDLEIEAIDE